MSEGRSDEDRARRGVGKRSGVAWRVGNKGKVYLGVDVLLPLLDGFEGGIAGDVEHHEGPDRFLKWNGRVAERQEGEDQSAFGRKWRDGGGEYFVVNTCHVAVSLLSCNVPQLQTHQRFRVPVDLLQRKIDPDLMTFDFSS